MSPTSPPFPSSQTLQTLRSLTTSITQTLNTLDSSTSPESTSLALASISRTAHLLALASTPPSDAFADFTFAPFANACVRIALSINLFDHLPESETDRGVSLPQLAELTSTDPALLARILRGLVVFHIIQQDGPADDSEGEVYSHTPLSRIYTDPAQRAWAIWMWDVMLASATAGLGPYFDSAVNAASKDRPLRNPGESGNAEKGFKSPFHTAHQVADPDTDVFAILKRLEKLPLLNQAMSGSSALCAQEAAAAYDFAALKPPVGGDGEVEGVVLVDVGGSKGATIKELRRAGVKGKMVLQDLQSVLDEAPSDLFDVDADTTSMPYDFFAQEQPVHGAGAYLYQRIFHDWNDEKSAKILESLRPAMAKESKLLICDVVVQDTKPHPRKVARDLNMLLVGGMERTMMQWRALLEGSGFEVAGWHGLEASSNSIIEARLR